MMQVNMVLWLALLSWSCAVYHNTHGTDSTNTISSEMSLNIILTNKKATMHLGSTRKYKKLLATIEAFLTNRNSKNLHIIRTQFLLTNPVSIQI